MRRKWHVESMFVENIAVSERMRGLVSERVQALAASMQEIGLKTPISVCIKDDTPHLIAGLHRLEAAKHLGWEEIDCLVLDDSDIDAQLWEVDENLARTELTTEEKREHLRRRKELWQQRQKIQVAHDAPPELGYKKPPPQKKAFAADTAAATGLSKSQINRLLAEPKPRPEPLPERSAKDEWLGKMFGLWARAEPEWREDFLSQIEGAA